MRIEAFERQKGGRSVIKVIHKSFEAMQQFCVRSRLKFYSKPLRQSRVIELKSRTTLVRFLNKSFKLDRQNNTCVPIADVKIFRKINSDLNFILFVTQTCCIVSEIIEY